MININNIQHVYFLGIGGIGMSALARYFQYEGKEVAGYDRTETKLTCELMEEGIAIYYKTDIERLDATVDKATTLVVRTPAIPKENDELQYFISNSFTMMKRAEVLGHIANTKKCIAVSGTHGKTSVSTMTGFILHNSTVDCAAFLGGISKNYITNLILPQNSSDWVVAEADEFDRSFLHLHPELALVTSIDADHLDIYGTHEEMKKSFGQFIGQVKAGGKVVVKKGIGMDASVNPEAHFYTYSIDEEADFYADNIVIENDAFHFDLHTPMGILEDMVLAYPGRMNVENAVGASALALLAGVSKEELKEGLATYQGVRRRFEHHIKTDKIVLIDDYAHHPEELNATIGSVRDMYPGRKITGVFQPHLYSRTRDFANAFAQSLGQLDELILLDIYPAREKPIPGITSDVIFREVQLAAKKRCTKEELVDLLKDSQLDVVLLLGAGDIDTCVEPVKKMIEGQLDAK